MLSSDVYSVFPEVGVMLYDFPNVFNVYHVNVNVNKKFDKRFVILNCCCFSLFTRHQAVLKCTESQNIANAN